MSLFTPSLWPGATSVPYRKIVLAFALAPLLPSLLLAAGTFLIAGMSQSTRELTLAYTLETAPALASALYVFTFTFGILGFIGLWAMSSRSILSWAVLGGVLGALSGLLLGQLMTDGAPGILLIACAVLGWIVFLLLRRFAGVRQPPREAVRADDP